VLLVALLTPPALAKPKFTTLEKVVDGSDVIAVAHLSGRQRVDPKMHWVGYAIIYRGSHETSFPADQGASTIWGWFWAAGVNGPRCDRLGWRSMKAGRPRIAEPIIGGKTAIIS
jgi:hypothetical protein